jgi:hypothetical protein
MEVAPEFYEPEEVQFFGVFGLKWLHCCGHFVLFGFFIFPMEKKPSSNPTPSCRL